MSDKIVFRVCDHQPQMDRIYINGLYAGTFPSWIFRGLPDDKRSIAYNALRDLYYLGFRKGGEHKAVEVKKAIHGLKQCLK